MQAKMKKSKKLKTFVKSQKVKSVTQCFDTCEYMFHTNYVLNHNIKIVVSNADRFFIIVEKKSIKTSVKLPYVARRGWLVRSIILVGS